MSAEKRMCGESDVGEVAEAIKPCLYTSNVEEYAGKLSPTNKGSGVPRVVA